MTPIAYPIVVFFYPHWTIDGFALRVWQGDTLIAAEPLSWVCPLPHLVLPLSGCMSWRTPTRATRGDARGHRSVLAQNPLLMYPSFSFLWTCRRPGVSSPYGGRAPMCLCCCGCIPAWCRPMALPCGHVCAEGHTTRWPWLCVLFVHRPSVWV